MLLPIKASLQIEQTVNATDVSSPINGSVSITVAGVTVDASVSVKGIGPDSVESLAELALGLFSAVSAKFPSKK